MPARKFGTYSDRYHTPAWRRITKLVRSRAQNVCERCGSSAPPLACHHILAIRDGGTEDLSNLILLDRKCHHNAHAEGQQGWRQIPLTQITLITGPPGADLLGKCRELSRYSNDVIISFELIAESMFEDVTDFALLNDDDRAEVSAKRAELIHDLRQGKLPHPCRRVFVTSSHPDPSFLPHHLDPVVVDPGIAAMLLKIESGELPELYRDLILRYYSDREQGDEEYARSKHGKPKENAQ